MSDVLFDVNSSDLTPDANSRLGAFLTLAARDKKRHLLVEGFTDSDGDAGVQPAAQRGPRRVGRASGSPARASTPPGFPQSAMAPIRRSPNDTPENKALNRRVVVTLQTAGQ